jgi:hypothetical protein
LNYPLFHTRILIIFRLPRPGVRAARVPYLRRPTRWTGQRHVFFSFVFDSHQHNDPFSHSTSPYLFPYAHFPSSTLSSQRLRVTAAAEAFATTTPEGNVDTCTYVSLQIRTQHLTNLRLWYGQMSMLQRLRGLWLPGKRRGTAVAEERTKENTDGISERDE